MTRPILVVTCGNSDGGDDQFGHLVAQQLAAAAWPNVDVVNAGMNPCTLTDHLDRRDVLIVVDAVWWPGCKPGDIIDADLNEGELPKLADDCQRSSHSLSIMDQVALARTLDMLPPVARLVGVTIDAARVGAAMSQPVRRRVRDVVRLIQKRRQEMLPGKA